MIEREAPGMSLAMLMGSLNVTPLGMLSRSGAPFILVPARGGGRKREFMIVNHHVVNLLLNLVASFSIQIFTSLADEEALF